MTLESTIKAVDEDRFERERRIGWFDLERLAKARVLIVGAGALGNEVAKNLALIGCRNISIVDMDTVEPSNLSRCLFFNMDDAKNKRGKAEVLGGRLGAIEGVTAIYYSSKIQDMHETFIRGFDMVFGCLDNIEARLHVNAHCCSYGVPYVDGGTNGLIGKVQVVISPNTPCLECNMNATHLKVLEQRFSCTGREVTFYEPMLPAEITTTAVIAAIQVREGIKILCGRKDLLIPGIFYYDGKRNVSEIIQVQRNPECQNHREE